MSCATLTLNRRSLFEATFIYKDPSGVPIDLTGLVDDAEFILYDGDFTILVSSMAENDITATLAEGRFDLLIPQPDVDLLDFRKARFQFRIRWITKGWQELGDGEVILDD